MKISKCIAVLCAAATLLTATPVYAVDQIEPVSVEYETQEDGTTAIEEHYRMETDADINSLAKESLEYEGCSYRMLSITHENVPGEETSKEVTVTRKKQVETDDVEAALALFPETLPYDSDGYTGIVYIDSESIVIENQSVGSETIQFASFIQLSGPNTEGAEDEIPRYVATVKYNGTVTSASPNMVDVTLTYVPVEEPSLAETAKELLDKYWTYILATFIVICALWILCAIISNHRMKNADNEEPESDEEEDIEPTIASTSKQAEKPQMYLPGFFQNLDRGGDDTLGEE